MKVVILSGTCIQAPEGRPEFRLGPGSYFMQPGGDYRHITRCDPASDCVFLVESQGALDLELAEPGKESCSAGGELQVGAPVPRTLVLRTSKVQIRDFMGPVPGCTMSPSGAGGSDDD